MDLIELGAVLGDFFEDPQRAPSHDQLDQAVAAPTANPAAPPASEPAPLTTSGYLDPTSGLIKRGYRYYDTRQGRFTQQDPSGQESNAYLYAGGDPVNNSDPNGLYCIFGTYGGLGGACRGAGVARILVSNASLTCIGGAIVAIGAAGAAGAAVAAAPATGGGGLLFASAFIVSVGTDIVAGACVPCGSSRLESYLRIGPIGANRPSIGEFKVTKRARLSVTLSLVAALLFNG